VNAEGKISLKLEALSHANQLAEGSAHQAITDVEATVALARIFMQHKKMWDYGMETFSKEIEQKRREKITDVLETSQGSYPIALLMGRTGSEDLYQYPVLGLGRHLHYKNQILWLRLDKPELMTSTEESFADTTWVARQKAGETFLLPLSKHRMSAERVAILEENQRWLAQHDAVLKKIQEYYRHYKYPDVPDLDVDADLYIKGFLTRPEEQQCIQFHTSDVSKKVTIAENFQNPRLQEIAMRIIGRHYPQYLTPGLAEKFERYLQQINPASDDDSPKDWQGEKRLTPRMALQNIKAIQAENPIDAGGLALLADLENYIVRQFSL
jgi:exodeoxyribonuclease-1